MPESTSTLIYEYHKRSDHGRDGSNLGEYPFCNCIELFAEHDAKIWQEGHDSICCFSAHPIVINPYFRG